MGNFNNFSFELIQIEKVIDSIDDISFDTIIIMIQYICQNGKNFSDMVSFSNEINSVYNISIEVCQQLIRQVLQIRNICSNWMNKNSTIGYNKDDSEILNDKIPENIEELKENVFFTCSRHYNNVDHILVIDNIEELRPIIYYIVECAILYSKIDGTGDWEYYINNITKNYNYEDNMNQINK
jgi:hypothetical protein